jgi:hypothetical protein
VEAFSRDVLARLPLAEAAWRVLQFVLDAELLKRLFEEERGTGWEQKISFGLLIELIQTALLEHRGSGRQAFRAAREAGRLEATDAAVYGKLRRIPLSLSEGFSRCASGAAAGQLSYSTRPSACDRYCRRAAKVPCHPVCRD